MQASLSPVYSGLKWHVEYSCRYYKICFLNRFDHYTLFEITYQCYLVAAGRDNDTAGFSIIVVSFFLFSLRIWFTCIYTILSTISFVCFIIYLQGYLTFHIWILSHISLFILQSQIRALVMKNYNVNAAWMTLVFCRVCVIPTWYILRWAYYFFPFIFL